MKKLALGEKKKSIAERMKDGYGSGWPEHRSSDRKGKASQKGKGSLKSVGKNEGEKMYLGKDGDNRA